MQVFASLEAFWRACVTGGGNRALFAESLRLGGCACFWSVRIDYRWFVFRDDVAISRTFSRRGRSPPLIPRKIQRLSNWQNLCNALGRQQRRFQTMSRSIVSKKEIGGFLAVIAALFVFTTTATAQVELPSQISFQGTALVTKDTTEGTTSHSATKSGGLLVGYSYQFNRWAGVEGNYGFTRNTQNYVGSFGQSSVRADMHEVTGSFVFHIPTQIAHVRPYALAGGGALGFDPVDNFRGNIDRQTRGAFVYGAGANFDVTRNFGVRA